MPDDSGSPPVADALGQTVAIPVNSVSTDTPLVTGGCWYHGHSLLASGGAATAQLFDGQDATGTILAEFAPGSGLVDHVGPARPGVFCRNGVFLHRLSGTIRGAIYVTLAP